MPRTAYGVQVVRKCHAMPSCYLIHLMFAVAVKGRPSNEWASRIMSVRLSAAARPVEHHLLPRVAHCELSALISYRQSDDQAADLILAPRRIDVGSELATRPAVHVQFVELCSDAASVLVVPKLRQKKLRDDVYYAGFVRAEGRCELGRV